MKAPKFELTVSMRVALRTGVRVGAVALGWALAGCGSLGPNGTGSGSRGRGGSSGEGTTPDLTLGRCSAPTEDLGPLQPNAAAKFGGFKVIGYFPQWQPHKLSDVQFNRLTHAVYFRALPRDDGTIEDKDVFCGDMHTLVQEAHAAGTAAMLSIGGASTSKSFLAMAADETSRKAFAVNIRDYCLRHKLDGIDIDWEGEGGPSSKAYENLDLFFQELYPVLKAANLEVSAAVPGSDWGGQHFGDLALKNLDWVNVMAYDFAGGWSDVAEAHSAYQTTLYGMKYWETRVKDPKRAVWGVPFYGVGFRSAGKTGEKFTTTSRPSYQELVRSFGKQFTAYEGDEKTGSYALSNDPESPEIVFYDSPAWVVKKTQTALDRGQGGMMIWELSLDLVDPESSLLRSIYDTVPHKQSL